MHFLLWVRGGFGCCFRPIVLSSYRRIFPGPVSTSALHPNFTSLPSPPPFLLYPALLISHSQTSHKYGSYSPLPNPTPPTTAASRCTIGQCGRSSRARCRAVVICLQAFLLVPSGVDPSCSCRSLALFGLTHVLVCKRVSVCGVCVCVMNFVPSICCVEICRSDCAALTRCNAQARAYTLTGGGRWWRRRRPGWPWRPPPTPQARHRDCLVLMCVVLCMSLVEELADKTASTARQIKRSVQSHSRLFLYVHAPSRASMSARRTWMAACLRVYEETVEQARKQDK